jgi:hypothetical protein
MIDAERHLPYQRAFEAGDPVGVTAALAEHVVLNSPVSIQPFQGRDAASFVLGSVMEIFEDLQFVDELAGLDRVGLIFEARIGSRTLQGIDYLRFDDDGLIADFTVMIRPLSGVVALQNRMAPRFGVDPVALRAPRRPQIA